MKKREGYILLAAIVAASIFSIAIVQTANTQSATPTWDQYCMSCHGTAASFGPRTVAQIQSAISTNTGGMGRLSTLTAAQLQAISNELSGNTADTTPPTVSAFTVPSTSTSLTVSITTFTATDNVAVTGYLITESATQPSATVTGWTATRPTSFTASAAGARTLYAWAKDAAGNVSTSRSAAVTITLPDATPPSVTGFTIPSASTSLTVSITTFTATDNVAVTGYLITESATKPAATAPGWSATAPTSFTASASGARTLYAWAKDAAGNVSTSLSAPVTITLPDSAPPNVTGFTIPSTSTSLTVSITTFTATDNVGVTGYIVTESATAPSASATGWSATAPVNFTASAAGARTLYAWAKDAAGNVSTSRSASVTITLPDATPPSVTGFTIPSTSTSLTVSITTLTATDNVGVTGYIVTESATAPSASATGWSATAPTSFTASAAGARTLYAWAKDAAGNVSTSKSGSVTITLPDATRPSVTGFTIPSTSTSLTVSITTLTATDNVGVTGYIITESATAPSASATGWSATAPTSFTASAAGARTLYAWAKDAAGNVSTSRSASVTITLPDATPPNVTAFTIPATSSSLTISITTFAATDNVGVTGYIITESATAPSASAAGWSTVAPKSFTASAAGARTLYAWAKDAAGNVSTGRSALVTIQASPGSNTTIPTISTFSIPTTSKSLTVPITLTATDNVGVTGYMVKANAIKPFRISRFWAPTPPTSFTFLTPGTKTLYAWVRDAAGNISAVSSATVLISRDTTPPTITAFRMPATTRSRTVPITLTATDDVGVTGYMVKANAIAPFRISRFWAATPPTSFTFLTPGTKTLYAWVRDAAGNISAVSSATVLISTAGTLPPDNDIESATRSAAPAAATTSTPAASATAPSTTSSATGSTATVDRVAPSIVSFNVPVNSTSLTVTISSFSAADNVKVTGYMVTESPLKPSADDPNWRPSAPTSYRFTTSGTKTLYAWVKDATGNISPSRTAVVKISLPAPAPSLTPALPRSNLKR